jgi:hypothetical protein
MVLPSLRALLTGVIDYAGLFPPARLPLEQALHNHARYRAEPEGWMQGRFVIPAARLRELEPHASLFASGAPFVFSVLGRGGDNLEAWQAGLEADLAAIDQFRNRHGTNVLVDAFEVRVPPGAGSGQDHFRGATRALGAAGLSVVYEVPLGPEYEPALPSTLALLAGSTAGVKLRTGGLEASAFPTPAQIAGAIEVCRAHRLPLKCTAGLHHPLRRYDPVLKTFMHGFLNVILAAVLAYTHGLVRNELIPLLEEESLDRITLGQDAVEYQGLRVGREQLATARQEAFLSFGSCSFDEPRDDLRALGLL